MLELNKVLLTGNLTKDPEIKYLSTGTALADLRLAVNRRFFDRNAGEKREETLFIDVTVWDKQAEFCKNYLHKGSGIFIEGRLKQDNWEDKQSGQNRSKIVVVAERVQFADSKGSGAEGGGSGGGAEAPNAPAAQPAWPAPAGRVSEDVETPGVAGAPGNTEDDLPF
jgi:single-strand DNA-binding protein